MNCPKCGKPIPSGADRCSVCNGAPSARAEATCAGAPPPNYDSFADAPVSGERTPVATDATVLPASSVIAGRFEVLRMLGRGGMGAVYLCKDRQLERQVAMKRLASKLSGKEWGVQRFLLEAKAVAAISHQNVIQVFDIIEDASGKYIVMEFVDGESLASRIDRDGAVPLREMTRILLQVGMALDTVHRRGIVHRDIKPANIMITSTGIAKLGDFGIAQLFGQQDLTHTGTAMGTWVYASPEQLTDAKHVDHRSDIYSLGATMYEMITAEVPRHIDDDKIPPAMRAVVRKCLAKLPAERYQTAGEFVKAVTDAYNASQRAGAATLVGAAGAKHAAPMRQAAAPPSPAPRREADAQRHRRSLWRSRGAAWSRPVETLIGLALLLWALSKGKGVDAYIDGLLNNIQRQIVASEPLGGLTATGEESFILRLTFWLQAMPWFWIAIAIGVGVGVLPVFRRVTTNYRVSSSRLTISEGVLLRREHDFPLSDIQEVHFSQSILGRILGYGDIELTRGFEAPLVLQGVPRPAAMAEMIVSAKRQG